MLSEERYRMILSVLSARSTATLAELCEVIGTSESTVRRDLEHLAKAGMLKKVRGGAMSIQAVGVYKEANVEEKMNIAADEKEAIAKYAASTINKNDFVFIDAGTTTERMIEHITERDVTFVTNGFIHAHLLARRGFRVILTGGEVKASTEALVGVSCVEAIKNYNFTKCFLGTNGISAQCGLTTPEIDEASVKRAAAEQSYVTYILADSSKFGKNSAVTFADIRKVCIITDKLPDNKYKDLTIIKEVDK